MQRQTIKLRRQKYFASHERYWDMIESNRTDSGLVNWAFDFVSIHQTTRNNRKEFSLLAPTKLIRQRMSKRPSWEARTFTDQRSAKKFAMKVVRRMARLGYRLHVVNCNPQPVKV